MPLSTSQEATAALVGEGHTGHVPAISDAAGFGAKFDAEDYSTGGQRLAIPAGRVKSRYPAGLLTGD